MEDLKVLASPKEKLYILSVNGNTYEAAKEYVDNCISIAREAIEPISDQGIIAIEKDYKVIMLKEVYADTRKYFKAIIKYESKGFKVHKLSGELNG